MAINVLAGAFVFVVLILMMITRRGQPRVHRSNPDGSSVILFSDGGSGDSGCSSDGGGGCDGGGGGD